MSEKKKQRDIIQEVFVPEGCDGTESEIGDGAFRRKMVHGGYDDYFGGSFGGFGRFGRRGEYVRVWVNTETGQTERVTQSCGWDEPPSWVKEERYQEEVKKRIADRRLIADALDLLAKSDCNLGLLSKAMVKALGMETKDLAPRKPDDRDVKPTLDGFSHDVRSLEAGVMTLAVLCVGEHAVEMSERAGQGDLINSQARLPSKMGFNDEDIKKTKATLESYGIKFGEKQDDLFVKATLPPGWQIVPTDHSMWSHLVDDQGRERAAIFYKSVFYDRDAFIRLDRRFHVEYHYTQEAEETGGQSFEMPCHGVVRDGNRIIHVTKVFETGARSKDPNDDYSSHLGSRRAQKAAALWLKQKFPNSDDPGAYWS